MAVEIGNTKAAGVRNGRRGLDVVSAADYDLLKWQDSCGDAE